MCNLSDGIYAKGELKGRQEGRMETFCKLVADGIMSIATALSASGCTQNEFSSWMKKFYPNYKF